MRTARLLTVSQHALRRGGVCPGDVYARGVSTQGGVYSPVDIMTDMCKNITLLQLRCGR